MSKRSYQQFCPMAYTLDVIGERWTLLIIRELSMGPRRFSDLQRGLPAMGPNLLSNRLKELEAAGLVVRDYLPPPARSTAYGLTETGQELLVAMTPLAIWGMRFLEVNSPEGDFLSAIASAGALRFMFTPTGTTNMVVELQLLPDIFVVTVHDGQLQVETGRAVVPDLVLQTSPAGLFRLLTRALTAEAALGDDVATLHSGSMVELNQFIDQFQGMAS